MQAYRGLPCSMHRHAFSYILKETCKTAIIDLVNTLSIGLSPTIETEILSTALSHAGRVSIPETHNIAKETR